jgi:hypothetical protein
MNEIISPQYIISFFALTISILSFIFARKSWHESNRPIVIAYIQEEEISTTGGAFSIILSNTGNRPATNISLYARDIDIRHIFENNTDPKIIKIAENIFKNGNKVALLKNGSEIKTALGKFSIVGQERKGLKYDSWLPIIITYNDLNTKNYVSELSLKIRGLDGFGGGRWSSKNEKSC